MHLPRSRASSSDALFSVRNDALSILCKLGGFFMAVIQKKTNELESMMASFAAIPDFEKAGTDPKKDKRLQEDKKK